MIQPCLCVIVHKIIPSCVHLKEEDLHVDLHQEIKKFLEINFLPKILGQNTYDLTQE